LLKERGIKQIRGFIQKIKTIIYETKFT